MGRGMCLYLCVFQSILLNFVFVFEDYGSVFYVWLLLYFWAFCPEGFLNLVILLKVLL